MKYAILTAGLHVLKIVEHKKGLKAQNNIVLIPDSAIVEVGYSFDKQNNRFIPPQPHLSWVLDVSTLIWKAPIAKLTNQSHWQWSEFKQAWQNPQDDELNTVFNALKLKGMPFLDKQGNTYYMQARDRDRINVLGLYVAAKDFLQAGDSVFFTPFEDVEDVEIERDSFIAICATYFRFYSALHFARKKTQTTLKASSVENVQASFETELDAILNP
jgi:hypothetical protein